jgi:hypothetical protein
LCWNTLLPLATKNSINPDIQPNWREYWILGPAARHSIFWLPYLRVIAKGGKKRIRYFSILLLGGRGSFTGPNKNKKKKSHPLPIN